MLIVDSKNEQFHTHKAVMPAVDDGSEINIKWHFPRGMLEKRMSGFELAVFVQPHMEAIISCRLLSHHPRAEIEFAAALNRLRTWRKDALDQVLSWLRVEYHEQDDDVIHLSLHDRTPQKQRKTRFLVTGTKR